MKNYLLYVLVNFDLFHYIEMFKLFIYSVTKYSSVSKIDLLIICDRHAKKKLENMEELQMFKNHYWHVVRQQDTSFKTALLRKFEICNFPHLLDYKKVMYLDIDVLVIDDLLKVFKMVPVRHNTLYATKEGDLEEKHWYLNAYNEGNVAQLKKEGINSFNTGLFMFKPSDTMIHHFKDLYIFSLEYKGHQSFYDQSFMNYYFNMKRMGNTKYMNNIYVMFPKEDKKYKNKIILHFAGLGRYQDKVSIMTKYIERFNI